MTLREQIHARALALTGELEAREDGLLELFAESALRTLEGRLKEGVTAQDCQDALVDAGSLYALASLLEADGGPQRFAAGELTVEKGDAVMVAAALRRQGDRIVGPFAEDGFVFAGV